MAVSKNQAIIDYLLQCQQIYDSPLYFNFVNAKDDSNQFLTVANDQYSNISYVDGSALKYYTFTIITFKSATDIPVVKVTGYPHENLSELETIQTLIDWVNEQEKLKNYPDFGTDCIIQSIKSLTEEPNFDGIDDEVSPPLAVYSTSIQVEYIDTSKVIWR